MFFIYDFLLYNYELHISSLHNRLKCKIKSLKTPEKQQKAPYLHGAPTAILAFVNCCFQHLSLADRSESSSTSLQLAHQCMSAALEGLAGKKGVDLVSVSF